MWTGCRQDFPSTCTQSILIWESHHLCPPITANLSVSCAATPAYSGSNLVCDTLAVHEMFRRSSKAPLVKLGNMCHPWVQPLRLLSWQEL